MHRVLELACQTIHLDEVVGSATHPPRFADAAGMLETGARIGANVPLVVADDDQADAVQAKVAKPIIEHQARRFGPVAFAPAVFLANPNVELGGAINLVYLFEGGHSDWPRRQSLVDAEYRLGIFPQRTFKTLLVRLEGR